MSDVPTYTINPAPTYTLSLRENRGGNWTWVLDTHPQVLAHGGDFPSAAAARESALNTLHPEITGALFVTVSPMGVNGRKA